MSWWPQHSDEEIQAVLRVLMSGKTSYWSEDSVGQKFEKEFAAYTGVSHALTCSSGTTALELALHTIQDRSSYNEVLCPARTFMATASAIVTAGMQPVLADISAETLNVTVDTLEARRTERTRAAIVVHFGGLPCDMVPIIAWAKQHNIFLIEDAAHAHGARIHGQHVGTFGDIGCFSFCVGKTMSLGGEGGMCITDNPELHKRMGARRDHGRYQLAGAKDMTQFQWTVNEFGTNARMTEMQSAIGRVQLQKLRDWVWKRNQHAKLYDKIVPSIPIPTGWTHGKYLHIILVDNRDVVMERMNKDGFAARIGGCPNIGYEKAFHGMAAPCPVADAVGKRTLALPVYPTMEKEDIDRVCDSLKAALKYP